MMHGPPENDEARSLTGRRQSTKCKTKISYLARRCKMLWRSASRPTPISRRFCRYSPTDSGGRPETSSEFKPKPKRNPMKSYKTYSESAYLKKEDFPEPETLTITEVRE